MFAHRLSPAKHLALSLLVLALVLCFHIPAQAAQVTLAWNANSPTPDGYRLFQRTQGSTYNYSAPVWSGTGTSCTLANLTDSTSYLFVVRAFVGSDISGDSNEIAFRSDPPAPVTYTITATVGANGTISPAGSRAVSQGGSQAYTITANTGYSIASVLVDGASVGAVSSYTFSAVNANHTISATFTANTYTITATAGANGSITPAGASSVTYGSSRAYTITANTGYSIASVLVDGASVGAVSSYTFSAVNANHTISAQFELTNQPPTADAGPDQSVDEAQQVILNGLNSMDTDDGVASFQWRQIQGASVVLTNSTEPEASFTAPDVTVAGAALVFELTVTDYCGVAVVDTCIVNVTWVNVAPTAQAGGDQTVSSGDLVTIDASSSLDADNGITAYRWVQLQGPAVTLSNVATAQPSFTAPAVGAQGASIVFELTVTDGGGLQDSDTCMVTIEWENAQPVADAGDDQQVNEGVQTILDGSASMDPDDGIAAHLWKQIEGPAVTLSDTGAIRPVFTAPQVESVGATLTFQLTVTDQNGLQSVDRCQVFVQNIAQSPSDTTPPSITITNPANAIVYTRNPKITLKGTASDNVRVERVVWVSDRGSSGVASGTTQWQIADIRLSRFINKITVTAYDAAGNSASDIVVVVAGTSR
jgi:hypothetical protein